MKQAERAIAALSQLVREQDGTVVAERLELACTFKTRLFGLMGRSGLEPGAGLWIEPCSSIHMMFVRFPIDVVFVDSAGVVLKVSSGVRPWLGLAACRGARSVIELEAGAASRTRLAAGDRLARRAVAA